MKFFLDFLDGDYFAVDHLKLREFGILSPNSLAQALVVFAKARLVEGVDYALRSISNKKRFVLTADAFKLCLIRCDRVSPEYASAEAFMRYFLFLEKAMTLYCTYQLCYAQANYLNTLPTDTNGNMCEAAMHPQDDE
ncbi:hypothetical protein PI124_g3959 [Phytophthora idaei]|nr:hypothetical protein PI125_g11549 [Phytophthora idaei]KAG3154225.1 hypothetical protein PI126_g9709 [Phytophthora idaei]KAG3251424.1 hypothetical protein PI124_g3959 [Phytophthora idaei]